MPIGSPQWMYKSGEAFTIDQSLRFDDARETNLQFIPTSSGNRKTFTFSCWTKRGKFGAEMRIFGCYQGNDSPLSLQWDASDRLALTNWAGAMVYTTAKFRDTSAWYHLVFAWDTTQGTDTNRVKLYINGVQQDLTTGGGYPAEDLETYLNLAGQDHRIGTLEPYSGTQHYEGYFAEMHFIDGTALTPTSFGETGDYGEWKPKEVSGLTYGTNGFYLPFKNDYTVEGFSATTYKGNTVDGHYIGGVGFQPDVLWFFRYNSSEGRAIFDSIRGVTKRLRLDNDSPESTDATVLKTFEDDGFTVGTDHGSNTAHKFVAYAWDMGGSTVSNTTGTITANVRANSTYGQSLISYTGTGSNATVGHGLSSAPEMVVVKERGGDYGHWYVWHTGFANTHAMYLNETAAKTESDTYWNDTSPTSSVISIGTNGDMNGSGGTYIAYCFHSVAGYSSFGTYAGNATSGNTITTGFKPAFVMIKRHDGINDWNIIDGARSPYGTTQRVMRANDTTYEQTGAETAVELFATGFKINNTQSEMNGAGRNYIYMAFADKREYAFWLDDSGNNNDWTSNRSLTESDISVDSPTNNFCTGLPLWTNVSGDPGSWSEGNLKGTLKDNNSLSCSMELPNDGKIYWECVPTINSSNTIIGIKRTHGFYSDGCYTYSYYSTGLIYRNGSGLGTHDTSTPYTTGDILGFAWDGTARTLKYYKNNALIYTQTSVNSDYNYVAAAGSEVDDNTCIFNFGQDSSFAGTKTAQGNQDGNDIGDFYYEPPTDYLALCTSNLPEPAVVPSEHFNQVLYTGNAGTLAVTGVGFQPDMLWLKSRSLGEHHVVFDAVRGATTGNIKPNLTNAEASQSKLASFDSDGFTLNAGSSESNGSGATYIAWLWKANGAGSANTAGDMAETVTVSANTDAGFSIVTYTGDLVAPAAVGHGLSKAPDLIIIKSRDSSTDWIVYHSSNTAAPETDYLSMNANAPTYDNAQFWNDTAPAATLFTLGVNTQVNTDDDTYVAYCFHEVDGFSKFGTYTGGGYPFIYTGFRPAWLVIKRTDSTSSWTMLDNIRGNNTYNPVEEYFTVHDDDAEATHQHLDFVSNGFKLAGTGGDFNGTGNTYIYMAFAETPFKYSNAR